MPNIVYQAGMAELLAAGTAIDAGDWEVVLERSTSTYTPNKDDDSLLDKAGWVEISVASYVRQNIANPTITKDDANDRVLLDSDDVAFGNLETGQTVKAIIIARNDAGNYVPLFRFDTDDTALLPRALGGGAFTVQPSALGWAYFSQA